MQDSFEFLQYLGYITLGTYINLKHFYREVFASIPGNFCGGDCSSLNLLNCCARNSVLACINSKIKLLNDRSLFFHKIRFRALPSRIFYNLQQSQLWSLKFCKDHIAGCLQDFKLDVFIFVTTRIMILILFESENVFRVK